MFIVAQDNSTYARLNFNVGPGGQMLIPTEVDYSGEFGPTDHQAWDVEHEANVKALDWLNRGSAAEVRRSNNELGSPTLPFDFLAGFEDMDPVQRQLVLDELANRHELWDEEQEVLCL